MTDTITTPTELEVLKQRADQMGITYHPSIGVDALRDKVNAKLNGTTEPAQNITVNINSEFVPSPAALKMAEDQRINYIRKNALRLVRVRISCMNPNKKEWDSELFSVQNDILSAKRLVPFNVDWHVEQCILDMIEDRTCTAFKNRKDQYGRVHTDPYQIKEFAVTVLPPLTEDELEDLRQQQAMRGGV
jgi:hypothetical protein